MSKSGNGSHLVSRFLLIMGVTIAIVVFFTNLIAKRQEERNRTLIKEQTLANEVMALEKENSKLYKKHNSLLTDPIQVERHARENLNYVAPDEEVFDSINYKIKTNGPANKDVAGPATEKHLWPGRFPWQVPAIILLVSTLVYFVTYTFENSGKKKTKE